MKKELPYIDEVVNQSSRKLSVYDYLLIDTHNDFDTFTKMQLLLAMLY